MILTQNSLVVYTSELDALETDTYQNRKETILCGSSMCRSTTSVPKLLKNSTLQVDGDNIALKNDEKKPKSNPLSAADMPQFSHFERVNPLKEFGKRQYSMSQRTKTKIRHKITAWARTERPNKQQLKFVFITLTLTSKQIGTDKDYSKMLNTFFTYLRKYYPLKNYLYVNERQQNGNIHTHMITDLFLPIGRVNRMWCKVLADNGYTFKGGAIFEGVKCLANPVDLKPIFNVKRVSSYVTKYVTKNDSEFDCLIWNCSNTISRLFTSVKIYQKETFYTLFSNVRSVLNVKLDNGESLHIHLLSLYHSIQKKHFKINENVLSGELDRDTYLQKLKNDNSITNHGSNRKEGYPNPSANKPFAYN